MISLRIWNIFFVHFVKSNFEKTLKSEPCGENMNLTTMNR